MTINSWEFYNSFTNAPWYHRVSWLCKLSINLVSQNRSLYNFFVKTTKWWLGGRKTTRFRTFVHLNFFLFCCAELYPRRILKSHYKSFCEYKHYCIYQKPEYFSHPLCGYQKPETALINSYSSLKTACLGDGVTTTY